MAPQMPQVSNALGDLLDEAGMANAHRNEQACPNCRETMPRGAILCIKCGYHLQHRVKVQGIAQKGEADAHGHVANSILSNAAAAIDKDKEDAKKETGEGMPWWALAIIFLSVVGFIAAMLLINPVTAFTIAGFTLWGVAICMSMFAGIMILRVAWMESPSQFFLQFVPFYNLYYIFTRWDQCGSYFMLSILASFVSAVGQVMVVLAPMMKPEDAPDKLPGTGSLLPHVERQYLAGWPTPRLVSQPPEFI